MAVFAGHPNLARLWLNGRYPNFTSQKYLKPFRDTPVFIYHGEKDASLSVNAARELSEELKKAGAIVTSRFVADKAHEYQDEETNAIYYEWLRKIIR